MTRSKWHQEFEAPAELRDTIQCFWYDRKDFGAQGIQFEVMPDGYAEIIFHFGGGCNIVQHGALQALPSPFIMGLLNRPAVFYAKHRFEIIGVRCYPWTVFDLLGLASSKDSVRPLEHPVASLQAPLYQLISEGRVEEAIAKAERYFMEARLQVAANSLLFKAGIAMRQANGTLPVSGVAAAAHATVRTLERNFKQSSGHTVKDVSALMRFEQVRNRLWTEPDANLAALAQEMGYADQSHLNREFKRYSGTTPAAFARKTRKAKQALAGDFVAFVQA